MNNRYKPLNKWNSKVDYIYQPKFNLKQKVFYIKNNQIKSSIIIQIYMPVVWLDEKGKIQMTATNYALKNESLTYCEEWLFDRKEEAEKNKSKFALIQ